MTLIEQVKFQIYATGTMYDPELEEKLKELGLTEITVNSTVSQTKLRSLFANENLRGFSDDCRSVILGLEDYDFYYDKLLDACNTDNTLELFDGLAMVLNNQMNEYQANLRLEKIMEDTLAAYEQRCKRVCKMKKEDPCR